MALMECKECGKQISEQATSCPHCGAPVGARAAYVAQGSIAQTRSVGFLLGLGIFLVPIIFVWFLLRQGHSTLSRVIGFAWLALAVFAAVVQEPSDSTAGSAETSSMSSRAAAPASQPEEPLKEYTARQLTAEYERNTVAADQLFKGKRFKVTGVVDSINTDLFGNPYVTLQGGVNQFMEPQFELEKSHSSYAASLSQGMRISLICVGRGDVAKTPMSDECVPAD